MSFDDDMVKRAIARRRAAVKRLEGAGVPTNRAHILAKIDEYRRAGLTLYDILPAGDDHVCEHCRQLAAAGPYSVDSGVLPDLAKCPNCRCAIVAHV